MRGTVTSRPTPAPYVGDCHLAFGPDGGPLTSAGLGRLPERCPYAVGDWVQMHGYGGGKYQSHVWGFRGYVLGGLGAKLLYGLTDDGRPWVESYGHLVPDGKSNPSASRCSCCPDPRWVRIARDAAVEAARPMDLLDLLAEMAGAR
jgi:hypothetical protein